MGEAAVRKIVVIDDDPDVSALVEQVLRSGGYRVVTTQDSTRSVELVRREEPDLILCDLAMPVMDGYAVVRALQADPETARYPVVFFTAHREFTERVQAFRFGVVDYIVKPFTREVLLKRIERLLKGLAERPGVVRHGPGEGGLAGMLKEAQRESRSGVLSVEGAVGGGRMLLRAGEIVETTAPIADSVVARAEFRELDPTLEAIVPHEPTQLPAAGGIPRFDSVPELLRTVLVVDDNDLFRRFLTDLLVGQGFTVYQAADGAEGLALALERRPWLILTDVRMPHVDGIAFCRSVRNHSLIQHTPLVFLSGWDDYKERYRGIEAGGDEFLSKDTPVRELLIRIQLILKRFSDLGSAPLVESDTAMHGRLDLVGAPGVLQMCHLGLLTGVLTVRSGSQTIEIGFRGGKVISAKGEDVDGAEAVFRFVSWTRGQFDFAEADPGPGQNLAESFDQLLLEGCRRLDESRR